MRIQGPRYSALAHELDDRLMINGRNHETNSHSNNSFRRILARCWMSITKEDQAQTCQDLNQLAVISCTPR